MTGNINQSPPPYRVGITQSRATRNLFAFREQILQKYELGSPEWFVLGHVSSKTNRGGSKVGDIAGVLDVQSTYVTGILRKLEAKGLVQTQTDNQDRRVRIITATKKGITTADAIDAEFVEQGRAWLNAVPTTKIQHYLAVLDIFAKGYPKV